jgi:hypothetical protein
MDRRLIPTGAFLAAISFFLPYVQSPHIFGESATLTGVSIGNWAWAVPLAAGVVLLGYMLWESPPTQEVGRRLMLAGSGIGLAMLLFGVYELTRSRLFGASAWDMGARPAVGPFLTLAGFLVSFVGAWRLQDSVPAAGTYTPIPSSQGSEAAAPPAAQLPTPISPLSVALGELARYGGSAVRTVSRWADAAAAAVIRFDVPGRYSRNRRRVWAMATILTICVSGYLLFLRPSPEKLGRLSALAFATCRDAYAVEVQKAEQTLLPRVSTGSFRTRGEALGAWTRLLGERRPQYADCLTRAGTDLERNQGRFKGSRLQRFLTTFNALPGAVDAVEVESRSQSAGLLARLHAVQAPAPSGPQLQQMLLGRRVDGWSFDEPSEFRALHSSNPRVRGDTLWLRAEADLVDYVSQEPYLAVLELRFRAAEDGEWQMSGVEPVLVAPALPDYRAAGEIFIVGRWRWPSNYAVYNADGTWSGRWDNGSELSGRWRIVRDRLVLTQGSSNWWSGRIQAWTAESMQLGDGTGVQVLRWRGPGGAAAPAPAPPASEVAPAAASKRARIDDPDGYTNFRAAPALNAAVRGVIRENEEFAVVPSAADWWWVRTAAGDTGYVHRSRVRLLP